MSGFKPYPAYKDSGVEWLGEVPEYWGVFSLKRSLDGCVNGIWGAEADGIDDLAVIRVADFDRQRFRVGLDKLTYRSIPANDRVSRTLQPGDLLIEKSGGGEKTLVGCVVLFEHDFPAVSSNFVGRMRPQKGFDSGFLCYVLCSLYDRRLNYPAIKQTTGIQNLDVEAYLQGFFASPPSSEQTQIARFLDHETARIDALIAEQERLIELLKEKRQAVISHAVTKGLNPDVPMKDSGVEWLGQVPAHWGVGKAGFYLSVLPGYAFPSTDFTLEESDVKLLRGINVGVGDLRWEEVVYWKRADNDGLNEFELSDGDVVIGMDRPRISEGMRVAAVKGSDLPCLLLQRVAKIHAGPLIARGYVMRLLSSPAFEAHFAPETTGVSVPHISSEQITSFIIPIPPLDEQHQICDFLVSELSKLDALNKQVELALSTLKERRAALISAAVTGKIDVRDWRPPADAPSMSEAA